MQNKEQIKKDIVVALDFVEQIINNPSLLDKVEDGAEITFLDSENIKKEKQLKSSGRKYVKVKRIFEIL